jgi:hypothetical protein
VLEAQVRALKAQVAELRDDLSRVRFFSSFLLMFKILI